MTPFSNVKLLRHLDAIEAWRHGKWHAPIQVEIDLTNECSSRCPFCYGYLKRELSHHILLADGETMEEKLRSSESRTRSLIDDLSAIGVKSILFTGGGDPTMHRRWKSLVAHAASKRLEVGLITNGVVDVSDVVEHCTWIRFSVDAASSDLYSIQHGRREHFPVVIDSVRRAVSRKAESNSRCTIGVGFLTGKQTSHEIRKFVELWSCIDVDYIQFRPLIDSYGDKWFDGSDEVIKEIDAARAMDPRVVASDQKYSGFDGYGKTEKCYGIFFETAIAADGLVYTCCNHKGVAKYAIGNLHIEPFRQIWERHLASGEFSVTEDCPRFCRHFGNNRLVDLIVRPQMHENFI